MNIQSILAVTDLSGQGNRTVFRAAVLAAQHRALLKIIYAPKDFIACENADAGEGVRRLAAEVHTRFGILVKNVSDTSGRLEAIAEEAQWVDMLVIGEHREKSAKAFFCGQPIERLLRVVPCPILLARLEVFHRYRRILVAVDFTPESRKLVKLAWSLDSDAQVELFHALNTMHEGKLRYADVSEQAIRAYRHESMRDAHERIFSLSDSSNARRNRVVAAIGKGDAARQAVVQQQHANADLLVVGKRRSSAFTDFLFGSIAQRVLWWSSRDVLLVPHDLRIDPKTEVAASSARPIRREQVAVGQRRRAA
ncbi:universal stress protein [Variovorax sp. PBL-E5]|uniref:universal stress protein n=1 Tax=Variovorax sp. PBL-E5 TaxID=434014 RepID=UPI001316722C|nr:universal stress protein [Variovorax sp. PBL-E5]VTU23177.1 universal stress protein UspC [Variovorax sp. PBL-E5]